MKTLVVDIDGVICPEGKTFEKYTFEPIPGSVEKINQLFRKGYHIILFTARSWAEYHLLKKWLDTHKFHYDQLICGKPIGDAVIDDRSFKSLDEFIEEDNV